MGTTFQNRPKGTTDREFFQDLMGERYTIVECATVNPRSEGGAFYAAVRTNEGPNAGTVWAFVALVHWVPDFYNFGYKDMDETMGPNAAEAPARVLDALTPLPECAGCRPLRSPVRQLQHLHRPRVARGLPQGGRQPRPRSQGQGRARW